jgi:hypothetical protein
MGFFSFLLITLLIVIILGMSFCLLKTARANKNKEKKEIHISVKEILPISEYACLVYRYSAVNKHSDSIPFIKWNMPFTEKKLIFSIDGAVKLGIDGKDIKVESFMEKIIIYMPSIKILSHEVYPETVMVYDEKNNIFNHYTAKEHFAIELTHKNTIEEKLLTDESILVQARESAQMQFDSLLRNLPGIKNVYSVIFEWDNENQQNTVIQKS